MVLPIQSLLLPRSINMEDRNIPQPTPPPKRIKTVQCSIHEVNSTRPNAKTHVLPEQTPLRRPGDLFPH